LGGVGKEFSDSDVSMGVGKEEKFLDERSREGGWAVEVKVKGYARTLNKGGKRKTTR